MTVLVTISAVLSDGAIIAVVRVVEEVAVWALPRTAKTASKAISENSLKVFMVMVSFGWDMEDADNRQRPPRLN